MVAINRFTSDDDSELQLIKDACGACGAKVAVIDVWGQGGRGGLELAECVLSILDKNTPSTFKYAYDADAPIAQKITELTQKVYGASAVEFSREALADIKRLEKLGLDKLPICMAKTQYSLSDDPKLLGCPSGFSIHVRQITPSVGAGFLVVLCGEMMKMPGLPKVPSATRIDVVEGEIVGLF